MLTDRFPFLTLVPSQLLNNNLLDGRQLRLRFEFRRIDRVKLEVRSVPFSLDADLAAVLTPFVSWMITGVRYVIEIDEQKDVRILVDNQPTPQDPVMTRVLRDHYRGLAGLVDHVVADLTLLPTLATAERLLGQAVDLHLRNLFTFNHADQMVRTDQAQFGWAGHPRHRSWKLGIRRTLCLARLVKEHGILSAWR